SEAEPGRYNRRTGWRRGKSGACASADEVPWVECQGHVLPLREFVLRYPEGAAFVDGSLCAFGGGPEEWIPARSRPINDLGRLNDPLSIEANAYVDREVLCILGSNRNDPASFELTAKRIDLTDGQVAARERARAARLQGRTDRCKVVLLRLGVPFAGLG